MKPSLIPLILQKILIENDEKINILLYLISLDIKYYNKKHDNTLDTIKSLMEKTILIKYSEWLKIWIDLLKYFLINDTYYEISIIFQENLEIISSIFIKNNIAISQEKNKIIFYYKKNNIGNGQQIYLNGYVNDNSTYSRWQKFLKNSKILFE